jgi:hypothetical protein
MIEIEMKTKKTAIRRILNICEVDFRLCPNCYQMLDILRSERGSEDVVHSTYLKYINYKMWAKPSSIPELIIMGH